MYLKNLKFTKRLTAGTNRFGLLAGAVTLVVLCLSLLFPDAITVSNSVSGRELPIYCVETPEKKVALSFDAAWGNDSLRYCLVSGAILSF